MSIQAQSTSSIASLQLRHANGNPIVSHQPGVHRLMMFARVKTSTQM
jgi:hypothetical protein